MKSISLIALLFLASCKQNDSDKSEVNSNKSDGIAKERSGANSVSSLEGTEPAGPDDALFVGDSEEKVRKVLKRTLIEEKGTTVKDTSYYSEEVNANAKEYHLLINKKLIQGYFIADGKLRNIYAIMARVPNHKINSIIKKIKSEPNLVSVKKGIFKSLGSPKEEFVMFMLTNNVKSDSTLISVITGPNANSSEEVISRMKIIMESGVNNKSGLIIKNSFVE